MQGQWAVVQLTEDGEVAPYDFILSELERLLGECWVRFPYDTHPKEISGDISDYPFCGYFFVQVDNHEHLFRLRASNLFLGPLLEGGRYNPHLAFVPYSEVEQVKTSLRKASKFEPRLGHEVRFRSGVSKGMSGVVVGRDRRTVSVETYLLSSRIRQRVDIAHLVAEDGVKYNLVIDGMNMAYRAGYALRSLSNSQGVPTGVAYGFIRSLLFLKRKYTVDSIFVVWDRPPLEKMEKFGDYKANRNHEDYFIDSFQLSKLIEVLKAMGVFQIWAEGEEADDVISSLVRGELAQDVNYIYSNDDDFLQLVQNGKTVVIKPGGREKEDIAFDENAVTERFGVIPAKLVMFRAIKGDKSDNLAGVPWINADRLSKFVNQYESLDAIFSCLENGYSETSNFIKTSERDRILESRDQVYLNYDLMKLKENVTFKIEWGSFSLDDLKKKFEALEFNSFLKKLQDFECFKIQPGFFKTGGDSL